MLTNVTKADLQKMYDACFDSTAPLDTIYVPHAVYERELAIQKIKRIFRVSLRFRREWLALILAPWLKEDA